MRILFITNLYPPHHAGTYDLRCEAIATALALRGHETFILTSNHGIKGEQRDERVERRLILQGAYGHPPMSKFSDLKPLEIHNHEVLHETVQRIQPDVIHVHSLRGLSKSLVFGLRNTRRPVVYDVADEWICDEIRLDPWLRFWNSPSLSFFEQSARKALELSGERGRLDSTAPTRMSRGYDRLPALYGGPNETTSVGPGSIQAFRFDRIHFVSHSLKQRTEQAGFCVNHGEVIYPGIRAESYAQEPRPASSPMAKFLIVAPLERSCGAMTAMKALELARQHKIKASLSLYGRGDSGYIAELRSFAVNRQVQVEFLSVPNLNKDMPSIFRRHDAFIYPAEWDEPFPLAALEAMAAGLPVVASLRGGASELIRHGENGLGFTSGDAAELASRIHELQLQPHLRVQMAMTAQQEIFGKYNESAIIDQIENYLNTSQESWGLVAS
jgi:glycosyltransferase involved in cell wall biosynthesis